MPRLLIINVSLNWGSTGRIAEQIGLMAKSEGWDVYYAHGSRYVGSSSLKSIEIGSKRSDYCHYLFNSYLLGSQGAGSSLSTKKFVERIKEINPDIIHIHNLHGYYINYKILFDYLNSTDIKVVWTLHDCWAFTGHCTNPTIIDCEKWISCCGNCPIRFEYPKSIRDNSEHDYLLKKKMFSSNKNLTLVPVSDWLLSMLNSSFLSNKDSVTVHNGVDLNLFKCKRKFPSEKFTVLLVSNVWDKSKGFWDIAKIRELLPNDIGIVVVGLQPNQIRLLPADVKGITRTDSIEQLVELYSAANIFVNPTYEDTFPTVNIEALACGTPVVTYNTGGSPEAVDEKTGIVVEKGDVVALTKAIIKLKNNTLSSDDCRKRAELYYDKNSCYEKYITLYNKILHKE